MITTDDAIDATIIKERINKAFASTFRQLDVNLYVPFVCGLCDEFILKEEEKCVISLLDMREKQSVLSWRTWKDCERIKTVKEQTYVYPLSKIRANVPLADRVYQAQQYKEEINLDFIKDIPLSPRSVFGSFGKKTGLLVCRDCNKALKKNRVPYFSLLNKHCTGDTPNELKELTDIELSLLTPVKSYGFCFTFKGGKQQNLKGTVSYMRVKKKSIVKVAAHMLDMGLTNKVVVLYTGNFTKDQRKLAKKYCEVRTDKIISAVKWLCKNNVNWSNMNFDDIAKELPNIKPILVDNSQAVESDVKYSNIEQTEVLSFYFPDGSITEGNGSLEDKKMFKNVIHELSKQGYDTEMQYNMEKEIVNDWEEDNFVNACLLQFPYGIGGLNEERISTCGKKISNGANLEKYIEHFSKVANPQFHRPLFVLIVYSMNIRQKLIRTARFRLKDKKCVSSFATGINLRDFENTVSRRRRGVRTGNTKACNNLLNAVEACSRSIPHTKGAAVKARAEMECLQHHFGMGSWFLTVTFDDDNSFLLQVLCGNIIDREDVKVSELTDAELELRGVKRTKMRLKFPGLSALHFEILLNIVMTKVVGWDKTKNQPTSENGLFGVCKAVSMAVEEQGRKTLHAHLIIWIKGHHAKVEAMQLEENKKTRADMKRESQEAPINFIEGIANTELYTEDNINMGKLVNGFAHEGCDKPIELPKVVDHQELRTLRHREGHMHNGGAFLYCKSCPKTWTYEEFVKIYLIHGVCIPNLSQFPDTRGCRRLHALCIEYQRNSPSVEFDHRVSRACYQHHLSTHTTTCFCATKADSKRSRPQDNECRFRMPDVPRKRARIRLVEDEGSVWFRWTGEQIVKPLYDILPKRNKYDLFQNVCCGAISDSKLTCNTNVAMIIPGPIAQYQMKYTTKDTQKQDGEEYENVLNSMKRMLSTNERKYDDNEKEAMRVLARAAFAHNKTNIIGASLASYLNRNIGRFFFSHSFVFVPLSDFIALLNNESISFNVQYNGRSTFMENVALNYLCRPTELEHLNVFDFYSKYTTSKPTTRKKQDTLEFINTQFFQHPSYCTDKQRFLQNVLERKETALTKVSQWEFPDTALFGGNIMDDSTMVSDSTEIYARLVLCLFLPFRSKGDLCLTGGNAETKGLYTKKLRELYTADAVRKQNRIEPQVPWATATKFLQNIQDCRSNCFRVKPRPDELQQTTTCFNPRRGQNGPESDSEESEPELFDIAQIFDMLDSPSTEGKLQNSIESGNFTLDFNNLKSSLTSRVGNRLQRDLLETNNFFLEISNSVPQKKQPKETKGEQQGEDRLRYEADHLVKIMFEKKSVRTRSIKCTADSLTGVDANGRASSIIRWGQASNLDDIQRRSFEVITASFVLTFLNDAIGHNRQMRSEKMKMKKLIGLQEDQLICFLHGPGGSGKSTLLNLVMTYCSEYCTFIGHPFTSRTIVVSAMSGVAATLLLGETTHSAVYLNNNQITPDNQESWADTRLLVVDEISFARQKDFETMDYHMRQLSGQGFARYGGVNCVFVGDMYQLEPVQAEPIYMERFPEFHDFVNCYIELDGSHRFAKDPKWGEMLSRFRTGIPTVEDIKQINERCLIRDDTVLPPHIQSASYHNKLRDAINTHVFEEYCRSHNSPGCKIVPSAVIILMDNLHIKTKGSYVISGSNKFNKHFYNACGEDSLKRPKRKGRVDPCLKLFQGCEVMLTENTDVKCGKANGTRAVVQKVILKTGETPYPVSLQGVSQQIHTVYASQVCHLELEHRNKSIRPPNFVVEAKTVTFEANIPVEKHMCLVPNERHNCNMKGNQFPIISNSATTGHKLQGCTLDNLIVEEWHYSENWVYVVISRVTTMQGLFITHPLSMDLTKYAVRPRLDAMLLRFKQTKSVRYLTQFEYDTILR